MMASGTAELGDIQLPYELQELSSFIDVGPERLALASTELQAVALRAAKFVFDLALQTEPASRSHIEALLTTLAPAEAPKTRSQTRANAKRKRSPSPVEKVPKRIALEDTPLPSLFVDGMNEDQIWEQLDLRAARVCKTLEAAMDGEGEDAENEEEEEDADDEDLAIDGEDMMMGDALGEDFDQDSEEEDSDEGGDDGSEEEEEFAELRDESSDEDEDEGSDGDEPSSLLDVIKSKPPRGQKRKVGGHSGLDDGFFDLAAFNAETEEAEARAVSKGRLRKGADAEDSDDEDLGIDLFEPVDDVENFDEEDLEGAGEEPFYKDFFDAPSRSEKPKPLAKSSKVRFHDEVKVKNIRAIGKGLPVSAMYDEGSEEDELDDGELRGDDQEDDSEGEDDEPGFAFEHDNSQSAEDDDESEEGRATIERLKDDLFAEEEEPQTNLSAHEKRMAELRAQIIELENENVAKKDWVLMGEATSKARPHDSLLQEDLEFERAMKAVPVITEEVVQGLEERIKARISESRYDDVVRVRPMDDKPFLPSRLFELQDTKSTQSLAQIYENEYTAAQTGSTGDDRDGKLKKEHEEIGKLWDSICSKLDALCNAHYVPKQPKASISTVANVAAATLESALPTTKSASSMLAPEEIFSAPSSDLRARSELTPTEKRALRTKERKARKKTRDALDKSVDKYAKVRGVKKQKEAALKSIVKSGKGVTVVGKRSKDLGKSKGKS
ncbi:Mpp10 protein [Leucogyrophana mollusca]|uniref:Mpp10 protein n=1 Tax=Leucogyrophana mollusca TaxID=85980 RepID=A0ACB8C095_9AGAM|nr:Mpp10 protein [Leucogyrophana mollusca]